MSKAASKKDNSKRATGLGAGPRPLIAAWVHHHRQAASESLKKVLLDPLSSVLTWLVVGIALALPSALLVLLANVDLLSADFERPARFSALLQLDTDLEQVQQVAQNLQQRIDIEAITVLERSEALQRFANDVGLESLVSAIDDNPLPHTLLITPVAGLTGQRLALLAEALASERLIDEVVMDTEWLARFEASLEIIRRLVMAMGALMLVGAVLILGNTLRLAIEARRDEIIVIKLIGGGDAYARRPFLYSGLWLGIGGGVFASIIVALLVMYVADPITELLRLYDSRLSFQGLGAVGVLNLTLTGGAVGIASAWHAVSLHLRQVEPR